MPRKGTRMNTQRAVTPVILLILVVVVLAAIVLVSAVRLLPPPPGSPTPTSPFILDRPEALSRPAN